MTPAAISFVISFLIVAFLSGENRHSRCFTGLEPSLISILCSANSLGTPGMSVGFQAKISLLSQIKVGEREFLFCREVGADGCCFGGIASARSICLTSASIGGPRMLGFLADISSFSWFISATIVAISFLPLSACALAAIWIA